MGYARHIGRVGALAVTLGVGAAIANAPGVAYADSTGTSPGGGNSNNEQSKDDSTAAPKTETNEGAAAGAAYDIKTAVSERRSQRRAVVRAVVGAIRDIADGAVGAANAAGGNAAGATSKLDKQDSAGGGSVERTTLSSSTNASRTRARTNDLADAAENVETAVTTFTQRVDQAVQKYTAPTQPAAPPNIAAKAAPQAVTTAAATQQLFPPRARTSVVPFSPMHSDRCCSRCSTGTGLPRCRRCRRWQ